MNRIVSFHRAAIVELNEAMSFYNLESPGLGDIFLDNIEKAIDDIYKYPEAAPLIQGKVRRKIILKFPYSIIYSQRENEIRILAIAHQKRRPFFWRRWLLLS